MNLLALLAAAALLNCPAPQHDVTFQWVLSPSGNVAYQNLRFGLRSGGPYTDNVSAKIGPTETSKDRCMNPGTYYVVITATGTDGLVSGYSNEIKVSF